MATDGRIFIFGGQAIDETTTEVYSIEDTVNWYQVRELINYSCIHVLCIPPETDRTHTAQRGSSLYVCVYFVYFVLVYIYI